MVSISPYCVTRTLLSQIGADLEMSCSRMEKLVLHPTESSPDREILLQTCMHSSSQRIMLQFSSRRAHDCAGRRALYRVD